jgi:hypothetical protein
LSFPTRKLDSGSVSAGLAIVLAAVPSFLLAFGLAIQLAFWQQQVQLVADAAALAASETARVLISGYSCENP